MTVTELTAQTLIERGHISEGTAFIEHGRYRLADAIYRLRTREKHLIPQGFEVVTVPKKDSKGRSYGEYQLRKVA